MSAIGLKDARRQRLELSLGFLNSIWSRQPFGFLCLARRDEDGRWHHIWIDANGGIYELAVQRRLRQILEYNLDKELFYCPVTFWHECRKREYANMTSWLWADLDDTHPEQLYIEPSLVVRTSPNRWQVLWLTNLLMNTTHAEGCNRTWAQYSPDGSGWEMPKFLRVPGTRNWKYPNGPVVELRHCDLNPYNVRWFFPTPAQSTSDTVVCVDWQCVRQGDALVRKYKLRAVWNSTAKVGDRSEIIMWLAGQARARGASDEEIAAMLPRAKVFRDKYGEDLTERAKKEIERCVMKTRRAA